MVSDGVQKGIITRIHLKNFVTYDEVTVRPGRNLNLIIGANGTGKSTIVSAIVLGLGGNPKVIGRATHVGDFVKAGQPNAVIEIDLQSDHNKYVTIRRSFDTKNHTIWTVNNKAATSKQITELMKSFNIQVDNLCQFLPQDKVQEFSNLSPSNLLVETERSVGDPKLLEYHNILQELRKTQAELEKELERSTRLHNKDKQSYEALKDSVGHINEQRLIKKKLTTLKQKKAWILYQNKREEFSKAKTGRDEALKKKTQVEKKIEPIKQKISKLKSSILTLERTAKQHNSETLAKRSKLTKFLDDVERQEKSVGEIEAQCREEVTIEQECDERINQLIEDKSKMENDLIHLVNEVGQVEDIEENLNTTNLEMSEQRKILNELKGQQDFYKQQIDHLNRKIRGDEQNLQEVLNVENKRLDLLRKLSADAYRGVSWLKSNQQLFSRPIHEPMILHINLKDPMYAIYFENIIPIRDLCAFVCEDKNDMNLLIKYLRDQQKLKINAVHSDPDRQVNIKPMIPIENIKQYGFQHYLLSLIDAPKTILNYIISMYRINDIPIGSENVASHLERLPDELFRFFTNNNSYSVSTSKYTGEKSTRQASISPRNLLSITVDTVKIQRIEHEINTSKEKMAALGEELKKCEESIIAVNRKIEKHKATRNKLQSNKSKIDNLNVRINVITESINKQQSNRRSIDEIRSQFKKKIQDTIIKQCNIYKQYNNMLDECYKSYITDEEMKLQIKLKKNELAIQENDSQDLVAELADAERNFKMLEDELTPLKLETKKLFAEAKESTGGLSYSDEDFAPIKTAFAKLPASIEEIFEEIQATQAKIFCLKNDQSEANRILKEYNTVKKNMENLEQLIKVKDEELSKVTEEISRVKEIWLPMLSALVDKINDNFGNYFRKMKCAGEVSISHGDNPMDFDKYGLKIRVKFRDADELQTLTRNHQSGGERAVTTAVYMIALQELTRVPFRCVDEINQGMDATNERRVFELIVNITSNSNSSQYFLLTPKLLPNLKYNDSITVLTIHNGKFMIPSSQFDINENCDSIVDAAIRRRRAVC